MFSRSRTPRARRNLSDVAATRNISPKHASNEK
jgi:hypothetical protein